ncbi:hypothetical protein BDP81DRAFT_111925 [Colletotrichum phormii]|uniref:Uncharacterized protein n=1 Tax=Colletotrichum phormii TaxID=359342 RepID=A0AAJ0E9N2_9PEZI|nr:uncharacterized protein BDP81DRAFT_111925 [Colletotrichum phormii]KAK1624164.1 hypothetical protein BDP81DRAFT_111925 [Colletotrichum phormii]
MVRGRNGRQRRTCHSSTLAGGYYVVVMPFIGRPNSICSFPKQWTNFPPSFLSTPRPSIPSHTFLYLTLTHLPNIFVPHSSFITGHPWPSSSSHSLTVCIFLLTLCCLPFFYRLLTDHAPPFLSNFLFFFPPFTPTSSSPSHTPRSKQLHPPSGKYWRP